MPCLVYNLPAAIIGHPTVPLGANATGIGLGDLLLPPPVSVAVSILVTLGLWGWGTWLGRRLCGSSSAGTIETAAGFFLAAGAVAALFHGLGLAGQVSLPLLRVLGIGLVGSGLWHAFRAMPLTLRRLKAEVTTLWRAGSRLERGALVCVGLILTGLALVAMGPPTDVDSLHYHLGVPLEWIRHGAIVPLPDWLHARLVGLGEALILLGLVLGTDNLGAVLGWAGLMFACAAIGASVRRPGARVLGMLLVVACPIMPYLVATQKAQLLPAAATFVAVLLLRRHRRAPTAGVFVLAFGCAGFALGCKHSFVFSTGLILLIGLRSALRSGRLGRALAAAAFCIILLAGPVFARNLVFYGDPISPFLERWKQDADPVLTGFAWYLRNFERPHSAEQLLRLPVALVIPNVPREISGVLGIGALAILLGIGGRRTDRTLFHAAIALAFVTVLFGQWNARFFLEPYLWSVAAVAGEFSRRAAKPLLVATLLQGIFVAGCAAVGAWSLFPGAWSTQWRESVMSRIAVGYAVNQWLDETLAPDAVIAGHIRNYATLPRPFVPVDIFYQIENTRLPAAEKRRRIIETLDRYGVNVLVICPQASTRSFDRVRSRAGGLLAPPAVFREGARNPFNAGVRYRVLAVRYRSGTLPNRRKDAAIP